ncbi:CHAT domain-containing protein [uncultured Aquimarina sp.]|uniref:CHAT domain-containing protein n=1 Tax=uncultured Aquimarina sp. TaxID=575652 RepID=UPI0026201BF2|nr:CHAT domain-containing protein [uncultured Aquimarina sp.]
MIKIKLSKKYISIFLLSFYYIVCFAQRPSVAYYKIRNTESYTDINKISTIEELLKKHVKDKDSLQYGIDLTAFSFWLYQNEYFDLGTAKSEKAVKFFKTHTPQNDKLYLYNLGLLADFYSRVEDYTSSNDIHFKTLKIKGNKKKSGEIYKKIAANYNAEANFHIATTYYLKAIEKFREEQKYRKLFDTTLLLSDNYQNILDDTNIIKGIECLKKLDTIKNKIDYSLFDEYLINQRLGNLHNYENLFDPCASLPYYKKALSIAKELNNNRNLCLINNNIGYIYRNVDNDSTLFYFKKAFTYTHQDKNLNAAVLSSLGLAYLDQKEYDKAYTSLNLSLDKLKINQKKGKFSEKHTIKLSDKNLGIELLKNIAITQIKRYEDENSKELLEDALLHLKQADQLIDLIKLESTHQESKLFWRGLASDIYINLVKVCYLLNDSELAYYYLEKNKALLLLEDLTKERSKTFFNIPDSVIKRDHFLKRKIARIQNKSLSEEFNDEIRSLQLFDIKEQYKSFIDSLQNMFPKYYKHKGKANILPYQKVIKEASKTNTTFIHYILNDESGYGLVISKNGQELFEIHNIPLIQKYITKFNALASKPFASKTDQKEFKKIGKELYHKLLPNSLFYHNENKIIVIPDENLLSIPFEILIQKNDNYLVEDYDISYAYSISFLEQNKQLKRSYRKDFLGFAPIRYNVLSTLPNSTKEINTIAEKFDSDILLEENASKENLINSLSDYKIIHLSTHANANDSITPWIATNTKNITIHDIHSTKNNAELVTLSACNTSIGKLQKGEGVMSLARGFFNTGANSVVSTLWKADDQSTQEIITDFYTYLKKGKSKSEALRQAKLTYLKNHSLSEVSPYYWSSLVLIGDPNPMYSSINIWFLVFGILISSLIIFLIYKRISKK